MTIDGFVSRGHGAIAPFVLSRPTTVAGAVERLAEGATAHAGGIDVVAALRNGARTDELVHLGGIDELRAITCQPDGGLRIGAAVSHHRIETDPDITAARPDLAAAWRTVGNVRIRRAGTIGGNLLAFDPGYDAAPILAAADARLHWIGRADGRQTTAVADRASDAGADGGDRSADIGPGLLRLVELPPAGGPVRYDRSLKPVASVAVGPRLVAIGCAHADVVVLPRPDRAGTSMEAWLGDVPAPIDDVVASASYRRRMIGVLTRRLLQAHEEAGS